MYHSNFFHETETWLKNPNACWVPNNPSLQLSSHYACALHLSSTSTSTTSVPVIHSTGDIHTTLPLISILIMFSLPRAKVCFSTLHSIVADLLAKSIRSCTHSVQCLVLFLPILGWLEIGVCALNWYLVVNHFKIEPHLSIFSHSSTWRMGYEHRPPMYFNILVHRRLL